MRMPFPAAFHGMRISTPESSEGMEVVMENIFLEDSVSHIIILVPP